MVTVEIPRATKHAAGQNWVAVIDEVGPTFAERASQRGESDEFVADNYFDLKARRIFSAGVPAELGGGGATYEDLCALLRRLAHYCPSTALALSMHQHLLATAVWRHKHGQPGESMLRKVAASEAVLVSTGANDWMASSGEMKRVEGGFHVQARKIFCSGSPAGSLLVTSAAYHDSEAGGQVLHFAVPFEATGVRIEETWQAHGMRGTGSHDIVLDEVFVPDEAIQLRRPKGRYHPAWDAILTIALPLIMSVYTGVAESAAVIARQRAQRRAAEPVTPYLLGELENRLVATQLAADSMVARVRNYEVEASTETANAALVRKTLIAQGARETVEKALEVTGGGGYFRRPGLESLLRDVRAADFHPLPEKRQTLFSGRLALGLEPV
jgi:alkylation response protein AidB-like acyl-CoA dehydrogenase